MTLPKTPVSPHKPCPSQGPLQCCSLLPAHHPQRPVHQVLPTSWASLHQVCPKLLQLNLGSLWQKKNRLTLQHLLHSLNHTTSPKVAYHLQWGSLDETTWQTTNQDAKTISQFHFPLTKVTRKSHHQCPTLTMQCRSHQWPPALTVPQQNSSGVPNECIHQDNKQEAPMNLHQRPVT